MCVIDASINDADPNAFSTVLECLLDVIHASHFVSECQVRLRKFLVGAYGFGNGVTLDGPDTLDTRSVGQILASVSRLDLDRGTVENTELGMNLKRDA